MSTSTTPEHRQACAFCGRACSDALSIERFGAYSCPACMVRLGRVLVDRPHALEDVWPALTRKEEDDEDDEPEPKVRLEDGRLVELRERTAELKQELPIAARVQLASTYGDLGMHREQVLECGFVLASEPGEALGAEALRVLFSRFTAPDALERLRVVLFPS